MKRLLKKCTAGFLSLMLLGSVPTFASTDQSFFVLKANDGTALMEMYEDKAYCMLTMRAKNVRANEEKTELRFENASDTDSSIYVITDDTIFGRIEREIDKASLNIYDFVNGEMEYIVFFIPYGKFYRYSKKENAEVPVSGILTFAEHVSGFGSVDLKEEPALNELDFVEDLQIMVGDGQGNLYAENPVTRAEMAQIVVNAIRLGNFAPPVSNEEAFADVPQSHWAYNAIYTATASGHVRGYGDGTFRPEENVTCAEALKLLVSILGYAPLAEAKGGYPQGYLKVASDIGITKDIPLQASSFALRKDIARLVVNTAYLPIMEQTVFKPDAAEYAIRNGQDGNPLVTFYDRYLYR